MSKQPKFAVILAGSGVFDGSEIHESVMTMYSIMKNGGTYEIFAPDVAQYHVVNHVTGEEMNDKRNVFIESARIARGNIRKLNEFKADDFDAIIIPGGFGAAKNLSTFAFDGANCNVNKDVEKAIRSMANANKPIGALCISPVIIAKVIENAKITIGQDQTTADAVQQMGATHETTDHGEVVVDTKNKIATTPCYMLDATIMNIADGANNVVKAIIELM
jgi:enhancing lycopene biosynthesis protein 2